VGHRAAAKARLGQGDSARIDKFQQSVAAAETGPARLSSHAARLDSQLKMIVAATRLDRRSQSKEIGLPLTEH